MKMNGKRLSCTVNRHLCTKASPEVTLIIVFNDFSFMSDVNEVGATIFVVISAVAFS
jgi:hypothetical protein